MARLTDTFRASPSPHDNDSSGMHGDGSSSINLDDIPCEADEALFEAAEVCSWLLPHAPLEYCAVTRHLLCVSISKHLYAPGAHRCLACHGKRCHVRLVRQEGDIRRIEAAVAAGANVNAHDPYTHGLPHCCACRQAGIGGGGLLASSTSRVPRCSSAAMLAAHAARRAAVACAPLPPASSPLPPASCLVPVPLTSCLCCGRLHSVALPRPQSGCRRVLLFETDAA